MNPATVESPAERGDVVSRNPATGEALRRFPVATAAEVNAAVVRASAAQKEWGARSPRERVKVVRRFQQRLLERKREVAELISRESGKPFGEALSSEVVVTLDAARFVAENTVRFLRPERVRHGNVLMKSRRGRLLREPYGVIGIISPWNYPFSIPAGEALTALALGNAVVLKPSESTPQVALAFAELLYEAGLPRDLLQVVIGDGGTGAALVESGINKLLFTGSVSTGRRVAMAAANRLLPVVLELGGKDPLIVLDDADLELASSAAVWGAFMNAGQTCLSVERCYVPRKLYQEFVTLCAEKAGKLRVGRGDDAQSDVGPLIHEQQLRIVESHVEDARQRGARVVIGGSRLPELGPTFYAPTVLADVTHEMRVMREETFGPVLPVMAYDSEDEAVRLANDSEFGLAANIFTGNRKRGERLAQRLDAGTVLVNDVVTGFALAEAPHGGVKRSGIGRSHGALGMSELVQVKYVDSDLLGGMKKPWWYGYGAAFGEQMSAVAEVVAGRGWGRLVAAMRSTKALLRKRL